MGEGKRGEVRFKLLRMTDAVSDNFAISCLATWTRDEPELRFFVAQGLQQSLAHEILLSQPIISNINQAQLTIDF